MHLRRRRVLGLHPHAPSYLRMTYTPSFPGPAMAFLTVQSNDPDHPTLQYIATGTGILGPGGPPRGPGDPIDPSM
jgi:hypothetical protein